MSVWTAAILMNPQTWVASGHLGGFSDPLMDCKECHERFRADKIDRGLRGGDRASPVQSSVDGWYTGGDEEFHQWRTMMFRARAVASSNFTDIRQFNLMFKTFQGVDRGCKEYGLFNDRRPHRVFL